MIQNFIENICKDKFIQKVKQQTEDSVYEVECFICFMPEEKNNPIKMLSEFSHIIQKCKCKCNIHLLCLNNWTQNTQSCPICRTKCISVQEINLSKYLIICFINIYVFIILSFNIYLFILTFISFTCTVIY